MQKRMAGSFSGARPSVKLAENCSQTRRLAQEDQPVTSWLSALSLACVVILPLALPPLITARAQDAAPSAQQPATPPAGQKGGGARGRATAGSETSAEQHRLPPDSSTSRWLEKSDRLLSPKFVAGESYGGIRGPRIVRNLQTEQGVGVKGLVLVSPVFDFRDYSGSGSMLQYVASLPTWPRWRAKKRSGHPRRHGRRRGLCARRIPR
jgi:hypothetical protein